MNYSTLALFFAACSVNIALFNVLIEDSGLARIHLADFLDERILRRFLS
jgi:hypothetical protein